MKLSIIVTTYNIEKYIERCLQTILNQTLKSIEVIVVDDASTDSTQKIIKKIAPTDARVKTVFFEKNTIGGVSSAANAGLEIAQGDYIGFADGDDWYKLDMFEKLYNIALLKNSDVSFCNYLEFDETQNKTKKPSDAHKWADIEYDCCMDVTPTKMRKKYLGLNPVPWRKIYKRSFIEKHNLRFPIGNYFFEDNPFHWYTTILADHIVFANFIGCYHRINRVGQTMANSDNKLLGMYAHHSIITVFLKNNDLLPEYREELLTWLTRNTCWISQRIEESYLQDLYYCLKSEVNKYQHPFVKKLIDMNSFGSFGGALIYSVVKNDYINFLKSSQPDALHSYIHDRGNIFYKTFLTVKHQGFRELFTKINLYICHKTGNRSGFKRRRFISNVEKYKLNQKIVKQNAIIQQQNHIIIEQNKQILAELEFSKISSLLSYQKENIEG